MGTATTAKATLNRSGGARVGPAIDSAVRSPFPRVPRGRERLIRALTTVVAAAGAIGLSLFVTERLPSQSLFVSVALALLVVLPAWLMLSSNYAVTLGVLALYLGLVDGVLKLKLNTPVATLGRDLLLYSIVSGAVLRLLLSRRRIRIPPLSGYAAAFTVIALVQVLNPETQDFAHAIAALRPHLEFVPLFFFGYAVMRTSNRLRWYLLLLCTVAAVNGVVGFTQFDLTPEELSTWGPGYAERLEGTGALSPRTFEGESTSRVRPPALGSDMGFGGVIAVLAIPALLTLLGAAPRRWTLLVCGPLATGITLGVVTSQSRSTVVAAVVAVLAFFGLAAMSQRRAIALLGPIVAVALTLGVVSVLTSSGNDPEFRYDTIAPSKLLATTSDARGGTLAAIPEYATSFPLGKGLGLVGPAAGFAGDEASGLNGESQFTFFLVELGVAGLLIFAALQIKLLALATRLRRIDDPELRLLLAGCTAPLFAVAALWITGPISATSPTAPYFWFTAGILAFWLIERKRSRATS
jgi:hypothetical protein